MTENAKPSTPAEAPAPEIGTPDYGRSPAGPTAGADPIAVGLQRLFAAVADEPVPDEFLSLLDRIEAADRERQIDKPPTTEGRANR